MGGWPPGAQISLQVWKVVMLKIPNLNQAEQEQAATHEQQVWSSGTFS